MKNKLILFVCTAVVMMLCACQPLNVSTGDSDVVTVAFKVSDQNISAKAISIGNPMVGSNVIYQYKAIPGFTPEKGKELIGATGDVWTNFPSVYNGSEFKMKFSKGPWTFYVRGVDKRDLTPVLKLPAPIKIRLKTTQDITFNMEEDPEGFADTEGLGTVSLDVLAQSQSKDGVLVVEYSPLGKDEFTKKNFKPAKIDGYKTYFFDTFNLANGDYEMYFTYQDDKFKTPMGPYDVKVKTNKETTVTGRIAHQSQFITYFSTPNNEFKYRADFDATAIEGIKQKVVNDIDKQAANNAQKALEEAINNNQLQEQAAKELKDANDVKEPAPLPAIEKEKIPVYRIFGNVNFSLTTIKGEEQKEPVNLQKKIGIVRQVICNGETFNLDGQYFMGQDGDRIYYSLPESMFMDIAEKHQLKYTPEHVITLRVTWSNGKQTLVAESEPITILFLHD